MASTVDIILLVYDQVQYTKACVDSVIANTDCPYRLIILDNGSVKRETRDYLDSLVKERPRIEILRNDKNQGFVAAVNKGLAYSKSAYVCVLSNDTIVYPGWLSEMVAVAEKDPAVGLVNPLWEIPKNYRGSRDDYFKNVITRQKGLSIETDWARGFCYLVGRKMYEKIGGLDMDFAPAYYDDWDYSVRACRAGFKCMYAKGAFVWHHKCVTYESIMGRESLNKALGEKAKLFYGRWGRPVSVLFIAEPTASMNNVMLNELFLRLLRDQNKIVKMQTGKESGINHTNFTVKPVRRWLFNFRVLVRILKNRAHNRVKRFNLIVASEGSYRFLSNIPIVSRDFVLKMSPDSEKAVDELISYVNKIKNQSMKRSV